MVVRRHRARDFLEDIEKTKQKAEPAGPQPHRASMDHWQIPYWG